MASEKGILTVNSERLSQSITQMGRIGARPGKGVTRLALSHEDGEARDLLVKWMKLEGLEVKIDEIGNIFGLRKGREPNFKPVLMGSHLDTVINAGIFDGAVGVLSALEGIRRLNELNIETKRSVCVACFTNEEGVRFQPDMMGSLVASGKLPVEEAHSRTDDDGKTVKESLEEIGYLGHDHVKPGAYFELHVEQGPILHSRGLEIGVVEGVQGIEWYNVSYLGAANHAGTTPIELRRDALLGVTRLHGGLNDYIRTTREALCTIGKLNLEPNAINIIPGKANFTVDFRAYDHEVFSKGKHHVKSLIEEAARKNGLEYTIDILADIDPVHFREETIQIVTNVVNRLGYSSTRLHSGAGHDAQLLHYVCPTGMIFVPSIKGVSHSPLEESSMLDISKGANVLLNSVLEMAEPL